MSSYDVIVLTDERWENPENPDRYAQNVLHEDDLVVRALGRRNLRVKRLAWSASVDWSSTRCAVFRSTWNYVQRLPEFLDWLAHATSQTRLINDPHLIRWNLDKRYLLDLAAKQLPTVPTQFLSAGSQCTLREWIDQSGWQEAVLKPAVSASGRHTYRIDRRKAKTMEGLFATLIGKESLILQPFQPEILNSGEISLMMVRDRYTHAVRKIAKPGEFRVQDDHGGQVQTYHPNEHEIHLAQAVVAACIPQPSYARVDLVKDPHGNPLIMEVELIEPELFFRFASEAASKLSDAIIDCLEGR